MNNPTKHSASTHEADTLYKAVSIGTLNIPGNIFLAPVAGYSDTAFRSVCIEQGAQFTYTEMVSSEALVRESIKTEGLLARAANETRYAVQVFGSKPDVMAEAAKIIIEKAHPDCIDINAGCPVPKITKTGAGSALMKDPKHFYTLLNTMVKAVEPFGIPITVKIRSGWTDAELSYTESAKAAFDAGVSALTIHPRTRTQGYSGTANHDITAELVQQAKAYTIPIFASGDVVSPESAKEILEHTNAAGIMIARGAMGNPFLFKQIQEYLTTGSFTEISDETKIQTAFTELERAVELFGESTACRMMRKRFLAYTKGFHQGAPLRSALISAETVLAYKEIVNNYLEHSAEFE